MSLKNIKTVAGHYLFINVLWHVPVILADLLNFLAQLHELIV